VIERGVQIRRYLSAMIEVRESPAAEAVRGSVGQGAGSLRLSGDRSPGRLPCPARHDGVGDSPVCRRHRQDGGEGNPLGRVRD